MNSAWTFGVEEEFVVTDDVGRLVPDAAIGTDSAAVAGFSGTYSRELHSGQVESASGVHRATVALRADLAAGRAGLASAARPRRVLPIGWAPMGDIESVPVADERHQLIHERFAAITTTYTACGCHVHVGVPDRDTATAVIAHLRPWLPTLVAVGGNSPFRNGRDTGYSSWRMAELMRFPDAGVPPRFADANDYDACVARLVACGALVDGAMSVWLARLSPRYPTVEIRAADVGRSVDDSVFQAVLTRSLVRTALADLAVGIEAPDFDDRVLAAALWNAARYGIDGPGVDPWQQRQTSAWNLFSSMIVAIEDQLVEAGDRRYVVDGVQRLGSMGTGADQLRRAGVGAFVDAIALGNELVASDHE